MTPDQILESPKRANTIQQKLKTPQNIRKNPCVSGPFFRGFVVQETPYINATTAELNPNTFNDDKASLGNSNDKNRIDIDFKPSPNVFYLKKYKTATLYLFKFQDPTSSQKILTINKKITKNNVETRKPILDNFVPLETIWQTMDLYKQTRLEEDGIMMNVLAETWQAQVERDTFPKE